MPRRATFPDLHDADFLRARYVDEGLKHREIARLIGCSDVSVGKALQRYGVKRSPGWTPPEAEPARHGEPEPVRDFAPLAARLELADLDADVSADELARRLAERLTRPGRADPSRR
jgi:hypothetical protein